MFRKPPLSNPMTPLKDADREHVYRYKGLKPDNGNGMTQKWECDCGAVLHMSRGGGKVVAHDAKCEDRCTVGEKQLSSNPWCRVCGESVDQDEAVVHVLGGRSTVTCPKCDKRQYRGVRGSREYEYGEPDLTDAELRDASPAANRAGKPGLFEQKAGGGRRIVRKQFSSNLQDVIESKQLNANPYRWKLLSLEPSPLRGKKWVAVFHDEVNDRMKTTHFGAVGYEDYTMHQDDERKRRYLERHGRGREDWDDPTTPGALSRWILWNKPTIEESVKNFQRRFKL